MKQILAGIVMLSLIAKGASGQQVPISRVELMPNSPSPYNMRDWKRVALGYDSLVFNGALIGQYLPLVWLNQNTVNYPNQTSFGLRTVVGDTRTNLGEAINVLPAVVGATLAGIDKSTQGGENWAQMCMEYFNNRPSENIYLNSPQSGSGDDWWYDTMPNVFFYQLYALYPGITGFQDQFPVVADRWLQAVAAMGGSATPWNVPDFNHRGWYLSQMAPNDVSPHEPEAAGAIGWLLYNAYRHTGDMRYRMGAEWCMEFLNGLPTNPAYELQLAYGVSAAAMMNAELGTGYDISKMINWCFDVGPLRQWGVITGTWGGLDVHGLVGEVNNTNDYAFAMNTFEQIGALVPLARYDPRFARAIGKWVLNAANAARLFYPNYLPDTYQDSRVWSKQYDPFSYIAHEALRQQNGSSPYATGDAISGGWGNTNLALYGSSHVGILGGIIDTTDVNQILRLDVLKTDYFHLAAYPTFLYYNPTAGTKSVTLNLESGSHDVYDLVSKSFLRTGVTGSTTIDIPADVAVLVVITPAGGTVTYSGRKMFVNGVVVDYYSANLVTNHPPRIKGIAAVPATLTPGVQTTIYCTATDVDGDSLVYSWSVSTGVLTGAGAAVNWTAPATKGVYDIHSVVSDGRGGSDSALLHLAVTDVPVHVPAIKRIIAKPGKIDLGARTTLSCLAADSSGSSLTYQWRGGGGAITGNGSVVTWTSPATRGNYYVVCEVDNGVGGRAIDSVGIEVRDFSQVQTGSLVAFFPFNGNANDESGSGNNGAVTGASLFPDRHGKTESAYYFNGVGDNIMVSNNTALNFQQAITLNFWMTISVFFTREAYPISHGSWENRWKVSISNNRLRWTVKTATGTKDLDSKSILAIDSLYNMTLRYDGSDIELYVNGELDAFAPWSGLINQTTFDLTIGQVLPSNSSYNFRGVLDDIRLYDYGLSYSAIQQLYDMPTSVNAGPPSAVPGRFILQQNFPNPFNPTTTIAYQLPNSALAVMRIFDVLGRQVASLVNEVKPAGAHTVTWDARNCASGVYYCRLEAGSHSDSMKMLLLR